MENSHHGIGWAICIRRVGYQKNCAIAKPPNVRVKYTNCFSFTYRRPILNIKLLHWPQ
jgi:hypothetical protein